MSERKLAWECAIGGLNDANDDAEQTKCGRENFDDQDLHEQRATLCVGQRTCAARHAHAHTAKRPPNLEPRTSDEIHLLPDDRRIVIFAVDEMDP